MKKLPKTQYNIAYAKAKSGFVISFEYKLFEIAQVMIEFDKFRPNRIVKFFHDESLY